MEGRAAPAQLVDDRLVHGGGDLSRAVGVDARHRRVAAHAARVRALVAVEDSLVVLRGRQGHRALPVAERQERELLALEELLEDDLGLAEALLGEEDVDRLARLAFVLGDDHALARRQHVRLQHGRVRRACKVRRRLLAVAEQDVRGGRHAALAHQLLRVGLRPLDPRRRLGGPEGRDSGGAQVVDQARDQRRLGADDHEVDLALPRVRDDVARGQALHAVARDAGVARRRQHLGRARRSHAASGRARARGRRGRRPGRV